MPPRGPGSTISCMMSVTTSGSVARCRRLLAGMTTLVFVASACHPSIAIAQVLPLPPRPAQAISGSQLLPLITNLSVQDREAVLWQEISSGNVPDFLRQLVPVTTSSAIGSQVHTATYWVTPDYLAVGSDSDFFRMPMTPQLGQQLADLLVCSMPTRKMVDAIYQQAAVKLAPYFYSPAIYDILSPTLFHQHHLQIEIQRSGNALGLLVGGIKKDVVVSPLIAAWPGRVVIYGWHQLNGLPVQPLSKVHFDGYADYSHGIRLVQRTMLVDGVPADLHGVLADPSLAPLVSDEGPFTSSSYPAPPAAGELPLHRRLPRHRPFSAVLDPPLHAAPDRGSPATLTPAETVSRSRCTIRRGGPTRSAWARWPPPTASSRPTSAASIVPPSLATATRGSASSSATMPRARSTGHSAPRERATD